MSEYVLARYSIRSKQDFIFKTNRLLENVGASVMIADTFDFLFRCAKKCGIRFELAKARNKHQMELCGIPAPVFSRERVLNLFQQGELDMVELFTGGGNDTVLYRDMETCRRVNACYTMGVLKRFPGMIPLCVCCSPQNYAGEWNYKDAIDSLNRLEEDEKNRMVPGRGRLALPFSQMDRTTFQPLYTRVRIGDTPRWFSEESWVKDHTGREDVKTEEETRLLDKLVTEKGEESLLAIVHADGNNMRVKVLNKLQGNTDFDFCVNSMRRFTLDIDNAFRISGKGALEKKRDELRERLSEKKNAMFFVRWMVMDGDDATFICNVRYAKELTEAYLRGVSEYHGDSGEVYSACAGICIFHSHYPFIRAYHLAEDACRSAKNKLHEIAADTNRRSLEQGWLDFHCQQSGAGGDLKELRKVHQTETCMARPWMVCGEGLEKEQKSLERLDALAEVLRKYKVSRSAIKNFGPVYETDRDQGKLNWERICYQKPGLRGDAEAVFKEKDALMSALYDLSEIYDLWYRKGGENGEAAADHPEI